MASAAGLEARSAAGPRLPPRRALQPARPAPGAPMRRRGGAAAALPPELASVDVAHAAAHLLHHLPLAYEPVAAPCSLMNCGDVIHRRCGAGRRAAREGGGRGVMRRGAARRRCCRRRRRARAAAAAAGRGGPVAACARACTARRACAPPKHPPRAAAPTRAPRAPCARARARNRTLLPAPCPPSQPLAARSTLDPVLRKEVVGPSWQIFALLAAAGVYLFATPGEARGVGGRAGGGRPWPARQRACRPRQPAAPRSRPHAEQPGAQPTHNQSLPPGVLPGFYDYYFASKMQQKRQRAIDKVGAGGGGLVGVAVTGPGGWGVQSGRRRRRRRRGKQRGASARPAPPLRRR
jgi:hypothetical protein